MVRISLVLRGEIWLINLDPTIGAEIRKTRPAAIVSSDAVGILPLEVVVPLTEWKEHYSIAPWMVRVNPAPSNGLDKPSAADAFQLRSVSKERFVRRIGILPEGTLGAIAAALALVLEMDL